MALKKLAMESPRELPQIMTLFSICKIFIILKKSPCHCPSSLPIYTCSRILKQTKQNEIININPIINYILFILFYILLIFHEVALKMVWGFFGVGVVSFLNYVMKFYILHA